MAQRLAREQPDDAMADESPPELFAQRQAEAAATWRSPAKARSQLPAVGADDAARCPAPAAPLPLRVRRLPWADLLRRLFAEDILACPCGRRRSVTAFVTDQRLAHSLLAALGRPAEPAAFAPARDPPPAEFAWDEPA